MSDGTIFFSQLGLYRAGRMPAAHVLRRQNLQRRVYQVWPQIEPGVGSVNFAGQAVFGADAAVFPVDLPATRAGSRPCKCTGQAARPNCLRGFPGLSTRGRPDRDFGGLILS
jgi:hypothetical protein